MNMAFKPQGATRDPFSAFLGDPATEDAARAAAATFGWPPEGIQAGGLRHAAQVLAASPSPALLLVDISDCTDPLEEIEGLAEVCEPGTTVIACGTVNDIRLYRALMAAGIHDYLTKPVTAEHLRDAILGAQAAADGPRVAEKTEGAANLQAAVIGVRGGVGTSTLAVSLAWALAERGRSTAVLDLDVHFGTAALALDLEPGRGLTDAMADPSRIDGLFLERALVRHGEKLGVLSAEAPLGDPLGGDGIAFLQLQEELKGAFACTVVDLPRHVAVQHPALLADAGVAVLVTELTLAAARDTIRLLSWAKAHAPRTRLLLVANRVPPGGQEEIGRGEFEKSVEHKLDLVLPADAKLAIQAAKLGKPLAEVARPTKLAPLFATFAALVLGEAEGKDAKPGSLLGRLGDMRTLIPRKAKG